MGEVVIPHWISVIIGMKNGRSVGGEKEIFSFRIMNTGFAISL